MPLHTEISIGSTAVAVSSGAVTAIRVYVLQGTAVLQATVTNVAPTSLVGGVPFSAGQCLLPDITLAELFPGVGSGPLYLWAFGFGATALSVSHA